MEPFSYLDIQIIKASLATKTDEQLAFITERSVEDVHAFINELTGGEAIKRNEDVIAYQAARGRESKQREKLVKDIVKEEAKVKRERKARELQERMNMNERRNVEARRREESKTFKTRKINMSELQSVRIDRKTIVFVKPGTDINWVKKMYKRKPLGPGDPNE